MSFCFAVANLHFAVCTCVRMPLLAANEGARVEPATFYFVFFEWKQKHTKCSYTKRLVVVGAGVRARKESDGVEQQQR